MDSFEKFLLELFLASDFPDPKTPAWKLRLEYWLVRIIDCWQLRDDGWHYKNKEWLNLLKKTKKLTREQMEADWQSWLG